MEQPGPSSKRFTALYTVCLVFLPVFVVTSTVMYGNSSFDLFARFSKAKMLIWDDNAQKLSARIVGGVPRDVSATYNGNITGPMLHKPRSPVPTIVPSPAPAPTKGVENGAYEPTNTGTVPNDKLLGNITGPMLHQPRSPVPTIVPSPAPAPTEKVENGAYEPTNTGTVPNDRLLGGLLSSDFDEASCLSRYRSYLLRKTSNYTPSQYLISKLRSYEQLHIRCGPHSVSYKKTMYKLLKPSRGAPSKQMCSYLVFNPYNGLGNRMISMVAAFLYSVLTDRVLLVEFREDMRGLFCEPFPNSSWESPRDFPYRHHHDHLPTYEALLKMNITSETSTSLPSFLHLNLGSGGRGHEYLFHCDHSQSLLSRVPVLVLDTDQYMVPVLFMTPSFIPVLNKMFPRKDTVFHHLGRYLFHPSNEVWGLISRFYEAYLAKADEIIGLQVRVFNTDLTPASTIMDQILACTMKHKVLPEVGPEKPTKINQPLNSTSKAILVASLYKYYTENLTATYRWRPTVNGDVVGVYQPSYEGRQKHYDNNHNMKALADMFLLSFSNVLVTSGTSTFGYVAQGLAGLKPWILHKTIGVKAADPPCGRALSMEPCYHFPPKYDCKARRKVDHISSLFPDMVPCEDLNWGVKLVADSRIGG